MANDQVFGIGVDVLPGAMGKVFLGQTMLLGIPLTILNKYVGSMQASQKVFAIFLWLAKLLGRIQ